MESGTREDPAISIICTARNASRTISETIASVQGQNFENWEMIVVDDGSDDRTVECVLGHAKQDGRIHLVRTDGVGRARALNIAVQGTTGRYIVNIDADDLMHPEQLSILADAAGESDFAVICGICMTIGSGDRPQWGESPKQGTPLYDITNLLKRRNPVCHSAVLIRRPALLVVGGYDEALSKQIDYDLWIRLAASGKRIGRVNAVLGAKRVHTGQSFEARDRFAYVTNSAVTQARAIKTMNGGVLDWCFLGLRFLWALRPRQLISRSKSLLLKSKAAIGCWSRRTDL